MSGIEILGVAASVLQIAELGGQLSVKLFTFSRKIKNADKNIDRISKDIAATGAVLQQLGKELERDTELRLCSSEAVVTAKSLVNDCNNVFLELDQALSNRTSVGNGTSYKLVTGWRSRLKYPFLEAHVEMLRSNPERLKSSLLVMLNVLIFAEQLRNRDTLPASVLKDQRELLNVLDEEKRANNARFGKVVKALENFQVDESMRAAANAHLAQQNVILQANQAIPASQSSGKDLWTMYSVPDDVPRLPPALSYREKEIRHHCALVTRLVQEVSAVQYEIGHGLRDRMQEGVLGIHWKEWSSLRKQCGDEELLGLFLSHPDVVHFWRTQMEEDWRPRDRTEQRQRQQHQQATQMQPNVQKGINTQGGQAPRPTHNQFSQLPPQLQQLLRSRPQSDWKQIMQEYSQNPVMRRNMLQQAPDMQQTIVQPGQILRTSDGQFLGGRTIAPMGGSSIAPPMQQSLSAGPNPVQGQPQSMRPRDRTAMQIRRSPVSDGGDLRTTYVIAETHALDVSPSSYNQPASQAHSFNPYSATAAIVPYIADSPMSGFSILSVVGNTPPLIDNYTSIPDSVMATGQLKGHSESTELLPVSAQREREPPRNKNNEIYCDHEECTQNPPVFRRRAEWSKHMDKHDRPYKCLEPGCQEIQGFVCSGALLRHQRQVHQQKVAEPLFCPCPNCNRSTDRGFTRKEIHDESVRRRRRNHIPSVNDASARTMAPLDVPTSAEPDILAGERPTEPADSTCEVDQDDLINIGQNFHRQRWYAGSDRGRKRSRGPELEEDEDRQRYSAEPKGWLHIERPSESRKVPRWESDVGRPGGWDRIDQMIMSLTTISEEEILRSYLGKEWSLLSIRPERAQAKSDAGALCC